MTATSYVTFITVFLNKFLNNKTNDFLDIHDDSSDINASDHINCDLDMELELFTMMNALNINMMSEIGRF